MRLDVVVPAVAVPRVAGREREGGLVPGARRAGARSENGLLALEPAVASGKAGRIDLPGLLDDADGTAAAESGVGPAAAGRILKRRRGRVRLEDALLELGPDDVARDAADLVAVAAGSARAAEEDRLRAAPARRRCCGPCRGRSRSSGSASSSGSRRLRTRRTGTRTAGRSCRCAPSPRSRAAARRPAACRSSGSNSRACSLPECSSDRRRRRAGGRRARERFGDDVVRDRPPAGSCRDTPARACRPVRGRTCTLL